MTFFSLVACNNEQKGRTENNDRQEREQDVKKNDRDNDSEGDGYDRNDGGEAEDMRNDDKRTGKWSEADQRKFVRDCKDESGDEVIQGKLNDFCECMLSKAQANYSSYDELDKSNTEMDLEVFGDCLRKYSNMSDN